MGEWLYRSISALVGSERSTSRPGRFSFIDRSLVNHWIGGWVDPRKNFGHVETILAVTWTRTPTSRPCSSQPHAIQTTPTSESFSQIVLKIRAEMLVLIYVKCASLGGRCRGSWCSRQRVTELLHTWRPDSGDHTDRQTDRQTDRHATDRRRIFRIIPLRNYKLMRVLGWAPFRRASNTLSLRPE
jgi:hypothetical protein